MDVIGGLGPTWARRLTPHGNRPTPKWPCHVTDPWELLQSQSQASIQVGLINGQDLFMVDSWAHCHRLGSFHQLTNHHTSRISPCVGFTTDLEEQPAPLDAKAVHPRAGAPLPPSTSWLPQVPSMPLYTINRGCGPQWKESPFIFELSKLLLAFLLSISYRVVV